MIRPVLRVTFYIIVIGVFAAVVGLLAWGMLIAATFFVSLAARLFVDSSTLESAMDYVLSAKGYYASYAFTFVGMMLRLPRILKKRKQQREENAKLAEETKK